ncbi:MAG: fluoride efflux transporter CrcB [Thermomicrobiales bacterium]|nr:fluoride efflux transporter CrcB [Thermomicrobiales bacterium]
MDERMGLILVGVGGGAGAISRYLLSGWINTVAGPGPFAIFVINVTGAFLLGFFMTLTQDRFIVSPDTRRLVATGYLGGYTTFSTWSWETMQLIQTGEYARAFLNGAGSLVAGLVAVYLGIIVGRVL